jgi:topoisomerase-4 subunit A
LSLDADEQLLPPVAIKPNHAQVACLAQSGRLLVFALDELKLQPNGGRGLTLMDVDAKTDPLISTATFQSVVRVIGSGRGAKAKEEDIKNSALASHVGKRARKGKPVEAFQKVTALMAIV